MTKLFIWIFFFTAIPECEVPTEEVIIGAPCDGTRCNDIGIIVQMPTVPQPSGQFEIVGSTVNPWIPVKRSTPSTDSFSIYWTTNLSSASVKVPIYYCFDTNYTVFTIRGSWEKAAR